MIGPCSFSRNDLRNLRRFSQMIFVLLPGIVPLASIEITLNDSQILPFAITESRVFQPPTSMLRPLFSDRQLAITSLAFPLQWSCFPRSPMAVTLPAITLMQSQVNICANLRATMGSGPRNNAHGSIPVIGV